MYYNTALVKDWSNPKEITALQIAECMYDAKELDTPTIQQKINDLSASRMASVFKALEKVIKPKFNTIDKQNLLLKVKNALGEYFELWGGHILEDDEGLVVDGELPEHILSESDAIATMKAIKYAGVLLEAHSSLGVKKHNHKQNASNQNNEFLSALPSQIELKDIVRDELIEKLIESNVATKRARRIATKICSLYKFIE